MVEKSGLDSSEPVEQSLVDGCEPAGQSTQLPHRTLPNHPTSAGLTLLQPHVISRWDVA
jgi:hypothetical protein